MRIDAWRTIKRRATHLIGAVALGLNGVSAAAQSFPPLPAPAPAPPPAAHADFIVLQGDAIRIASVTSPSRAGGVHWLRNTRGGGSLFTGVETFAIAGSRWTVGNAGGAFRPVDRLILHSQTRIGRGRTAGEPFDYRMYEGGLGFRAASRFHLTLADQYWDVAGTRGHLIKPGISWLPHQRLSVDASYQRSAGGNLNASLVAGRVGLTLGPVTLIGGGAQGRSAAEVFDVTLRAADGRLREITAGIQIQLPRTQVTLVGSELVIGSARRQTLAANIKLRLGTP